MSHTENKQYWNQLISKGAGFLQEQNNDAAASVLKKAAFDVEHTYHDSWRWGTDYWELVLNLKNKDYMALGDMKDQVERDIMSALVTFQKGSRNLLSTVSIRQAADDIQTEISDCSRHIYHFDGSDAMSKMQLILKMFRFGFKTIGDIEVESVLDYSKGLDGLPQSDVVEYRLAGGSAVILKPSATEPKLSVYISVKADSEEAAAAMETRICEDLDNIIFMDDRMGYCCE